MFQLSTKLRLSDCSTMRWTAESISSIQRGRIGESEDDHGRALHNRRQEYVLASKVLSGCGQKLQSDEMRALKLLPLRKVFASCRQIRSTS